MAQTLGIALPPSAQSIPPPPLSNEEEKTVGSNLTMDNPTNTTGGAAVEDPLREIKPVGVASTPTTPSSSFSLRLFKNNAKGAELKDDTALISASGFYNGMSIYVAYGKVEENKLPHIDGLITLFV